MLFRSVFININESDISDYPIVYTRDVGMFKTRSAVNGTTCERWHADKLELHPFETSQRRKLQNNNGIIMKYNIGIMQSKGEYIYEQQLSRNTISSKYINPGDTVICNVAPNYYNQERGLSTKQDVCLNGSIIYANFIGTKNFCGPGNTGNNLERQLYYFNSATNQNNKDKN